MKNQHNGLHWRKVYLFQLELLAKLPHLSLPGLEGQLDVHELIDRLLHLGHITFGLLVLLRQVTVLPLQLLNDQLDILGLPPATVFQLIHLGQQHLHCLHHRLNLLPRHGRQSADLPQKAVNMVELFQLS